MNISDFARNRGIEPQSVSRYIKRHEEEFKGHIKTNGKSKDIDDIAFTLLDKKYPSLSPVEVIEDTESRKKLIELYEKYDAAKDQMMRMQMELNKYQLTAYKQEMLEEDLEKKDKQLDDAFVRIKSLEEELASEKSKSWWNKLRKK